MNKAGHRAAALAAGLILAALSLAPDVAPSTGPAPGPAGPPQKGQAENVLARWDRELTLPPHVAARLDWARRSFVPSGYQKLERLARAKAPAIAAGTDFSTLANETAADRLFSAAGLSGMDVQAAAFLVLAMAAKDMDQDLRMIMAEIKATNAAKQKLRDLIKDLNAWISEEMSKLGEGAKSSDIDNTKVSGKQPGAAKLRLAKAPALGTARFKEVSSPVIHLEYVKAPTIPPLPPRDAGLSVSNLKSLLDEIQGQLDSLNELSEMSSLRLQMTMDRRSKFISTLSQMMKKTSTTQDILVQNIK